MIIKTVKQRGENREYAGNLLKALRHYADYDFIFKNPYTPGAQQKRLKAQMIIHDLKTIVRSFPDCPYSRSPPLYTLSVNVLIAII